MSLCAFRFKSPPGKKNIHTQTHGSESDFRPVDADCVSHYLLFSQLQSDSIILHTHTLGFHVLCRHFIDIMTRED